MKRTTIMLPDDLDQRVRLEARRRGISIADVVREALEEHLREAAPTRRLSFIAIGEGPDDTGSERVDEIVAEAIARRLEADRSQP